MVFPMCLRARARNAKLLVLFVAMTTLGLLLHFRDQLPGSNINVVHLEPANGLQMEGIYWNTDPVLENTSHVGEKALSVDVVRRDILMSYSVGDDKVDEHSDNNDPDTVDHLDRADHPNTADYPDRADPASIVDHKNADHVDPNPPDIVDRIDTADSVNTAAGPVSVGVESEQGTDLPPGGSEVEHVSNREADTEVKHPPSSEGWSEKHEHTDHQHKSSSLSKPAPTYDPVHIRIMPKNPIIPEDHPLQLTCASITLPARHLEFDLPEMPDYLESLIRPYHRAGVIVLRFTRVDRGHQGTYSCMAKDEEGRFTYNSVQLRVMDRGDSPGPNSRARHFASNRHLESQLERSNKDWDVRPDAKSEYFRRRILPLWSAQAKGLRDIPSNSPIDIKEFQQRGEIQQAQVAKFCESHGLGDIELELPGEKEGAPALYRHILLNDHAKTLFCFAPKVGCTNLRVLFYIVQGLIPLSQLTRSRDSVNQNRLEGAMYSESFANRNDGQRKYAMRNYFKFIMYRNPLERLLSGYRSKVQRYPLVGLKDTEPHFNWLRKRIYMYKHPNAYRAWLRGRGKGSVNISFSDFIDYWLTQPQELKYDEHFRPIFKICHPCRVRYSFYGNFKHFEQDSELLIHKIGGNSDFLREGYYSQGESTEELLPKFYGQLSDEQKWEILELFEVELEFYYHIFPDENGIHKQILKIPDNIPLEKAAVPESYGF